ncbi:MAG: DUF378 domain-containing protein [Candidatus Vogelbacteria bacterium]|nr:DUF378 domain-containing protein [Candidatus Vogelbacteria bacterium]
MCEGGKKCCGAHWLGWVLILIGGLNWGLVGLSGFLGGGNWNVVNLILGSWPMVEWAVYVLVGLSAVMMLIGCRCKTCSSDMK